MIQDVDGPEQDQAELLEGEDAIQIPLAESFGPKFAERFDFTFNDSFYALFFTLDEYGEKVIMTQNKEIGRIISKDGISREEETIFDDEYYDEYGRRIWIEKPVIPINELRNVHYF